MELRPYQLEARERVLAEFTRLWSTLVVVATGLGKTALFSAVAAVFVQTGQRVLVVAHRGELLEHAAVTLKRFGLTVGIEQGDRRVDRDALPDVVVASVQTLQRQRLESFDPRTFGLVVVDEAHHAVAPSYQDILDHFAIAKLLGVTATPDRADGVGLRKVFESVAFRMELGEGIEAGWLAPLELQTVVVDHLDMSKVRAVAGDFVVAELEQELTRDRVLYEVAAPLATLSAGRQTLAFVASVRQAHLLVAVLQGHGIRAGAIDGTMASEERARVIADYRAGRLQLVANAQLLTEGYDEPTTSCVALIRPTRSRSLLAQMIGRGVRRAEGKGTCLVLDFVPGRMGACRLVGPADALAGADLPAAVAEQVRASSTTRPGDVLALLAQAEADVAKAQAAARRQTQQEADEAWRTERIERARRLLRQVELPYAVARLDVAAMLDMARAEAAPTEWRPEWKRTPASPAQLDALRKHGLTVPSDLAKREARLLLGMLSARRAAGLCSIKQAKQLRRFGLRPDVDFQDARIAMDAIASNGWKPPVWLYRDPRFAPANIDCAGEGA